MRANILIGLFFILGCSSKQYTFEGQVVTENGDGLEGVIVHMEPDMYDTTDRDGFYSFHNLDNQFYDGMHFAKEGYRDWNFNYMPVGETSTGLNIVMAKNINLVIEGKIVSDSGAIHAISSIVSNEKNFNHTVSSGDVTISWTTDTTYKKVLFDSLGNSKDTLEYIGDVGMFSFTVPTPSSGFEFDIITKLYGDETQSDTIATLQNFYSYEKMTEGDDTICGEYISDSANLLFYF